MPSKKGTPPPRYDETFKSGAIKMVTEQARPIKDVASDLGICIDTLRSWIRKSGAQPSEVERNNRSNNRQRQLEAEIRSLRKQLAEKDDVIAILKKSVGILSQP